MKKDKIRKHVAVYCSAAGALPAQWIETAREVGRIIAEKDAALVYGGVDAGLMREVADSVKLARSGRVIGVVPALRAAMASSQNDDRIDTAGLDDRKAVMQDMADVFVVLPGGYGTLDELTGALAYIRFNHITDEKILLYNPDSLYDHLLAQFETMISRGLMSQDCLDTIEVFTSSDAMLSRLRQLIS